METSTVRTGPARRLAMFASLDNRDFRLLWIGTVISSVGMWMQMIAQGWLVLELTDSPFYLGLVGFTRAVPVFVFSLWGGVLADRMDRRKLILICEVLFMAFSFTMAALVFLKIVHIWQILAIGFLSATVGAMNQPARQSLVPSLVGKDMLMNAIALNSAATNGTRIIGPSIAGAIIPIVGTAGCFFLTGVSYIGLIGALILMRIPPMVSIARKSSAWQNLVEGLSYLKMNRIILGLMLIATLSSVFGMQYPTLAPVFARDILKAGAQGLGALYAASGFGALICTLALASLTDFKKKGLLLVVSTLLFSVILMLFSFSLWFAVSLILIFFMGGMTSTFMSLNNTLVQVAAPDQLRGRVMGVYTLTAMGMMPLGSLQAGSIASVAGAPVATGIGAVILGVSTLAITIFIPKIRRLE